MKKLLLSTALLFAGGAAMAGVTANDLVTTYQAQGYTTIEVKTGLTQIKVEAVQGRAKVEVIYDAESGAILKQETGRARPGEAGQGVELQVVNQDFLGGGGNDDNASGDDDGAGHDAGDDHGGDDQGDDHGGDDDSGSGSDNSGHGGDDRSGQSGGEDNHGGSGSDD